MQAVLLQPCRGTDLRRPPSPDAIVGPDASVLSQIATGCLSHRRSPISGAKAKPHRLSCNEFQWHVLGFANARDLLVRSVAVTHRATRRDATRRLVLIGLFRNEFL